MGDKTRTIWAFPRCISGECPDTKADPQLISRQWWRRDQQCQTFSCVIFAFCATTVPQNAKITREIPGSGRVVRDCQSKTLGWGRLGDEPRKRRCIDRRQCNYLHLFQSVGCNRRDQIKCISPHHDGKQCAINSSYGWRIRRENVHFHVLEFNWRIVLEAFRSQSSF